MCNNNGLCGCLNNNWWWIVILILLLCNCGGWNGCENNNNNGCGCGCETENGRPRRAHIHMQNEGAAEPLPHFQEDYISKGSMLRTG